MVLALFDYVDTICSEQFHSAVTPMSIIGYYKLPKVVDASVRGCVRAQACLEMTSSEQQVLAALCTL